MIVDVVGWLRGHRFEPSEGAIDWNWETEFQQHGAPEFATELIQVFDRSQGLDAALALTAICDVMSWVSEIRQDLHASPHHDGLERWLETFVDTTLENLDFKGVKDGLACADPAASPQTMAEPIEHPRGRNKQASVLAFAPAFPNSARGYVDDRLAGVAPKFLLDQVEEIALTLESRSEDGDAEAIWWSICGGSIGIASRLVHHAEAASLGFADHGRKPNATRLRDELVKTTAASFQRGLIDSWARLWLVRHIVKSDRPLLEARLADETDPRLASFMSHELTEAKRVRTSFSWP